jgi:cytochrome c-type biogenesis protein CcmH
MLIVLLIFLCSAAHAAQTVPPDVMLENPAEEARAEALFGDLRCVVCQSESIKDSQAGMAHDLRQLVREKVHEGRSDAQILNFARQRYGDFILLKPPFQANTWLLWLSPLVFVCIAGSVAWLFFRKRG